MRARLNPITEGSVLHKKQTELVTWSGHSPHVASLSLLNKMSWTFILLGKTVKNKFLFTMTAYRGAVG